MCGIVGYVSLNKKVELSDIIKMSDTIAHRGPDGDGFWISDDQTIGFGHRRLSIIDLSDGGKQPMTYLDRLVITFNGEIYNYIELRQELISLGYSFNTQSDTEVVLAAYLQWGKSCLSKFDGMFAFAIWDKKEKKLFCARDRFGEKPFYYHVSSDGNLYFASEMKALWAIGIPKIVNRRMLFHYMAHDVVQITGETEITFYENIYSLKAAHCFELPFGKTKVEIQKYWHLNIPESNELSYDEAAEKFRALFLNSVKLRMRSDVSLGSSLSGGLDSSAIVCAVNQLLANDAPTQNTFSARFENPEFDEGFFIDIVKQNTKIKDNHIWPKVDLIFDTLDKVFYHQEEPFQSTSILAQWAVMGLAKEHNVTVLLDGQGSDEILAGYVHFYTPFLRSLYKNDKNALKKALLDYRNVQDLEYSIDLRFKMDSLCPGLLRKAGQIKQRILKPSYLDGIHPSLYSNFRYEQPPFVTIPDLNQTLYEATINYGLEKLLRFADRNSMAFSREVRLPFLSHELVEFLFSLPPDFKIRNGWTKSILRDGMEGILPPEIAWRKSKLGFQAPQETWMSHPDVRQQVLEAKKRLIQDEIIVKNGSIDSWTALITSKLIGF
jgi:asparagine synthase (glutamine-hydrolysing)